MDYIIKDIAVDHDDYNYDDGDNKLTKESDFNSVYTSKLLT